MINLYNRDCLEAMREMPDKAFDLAIVDPEYGIGASSPTVKPATVKQKNGSVLPVNANKYERKKWDEQPASREYFTELMRVSKEQIVWGVNYYDYSFGPGRIVWDKLNGESDQMGCEIAYCSLNNRTDVVYYMWAGMMHGLYCGRSIGKALVQQGNKKLNEIRIHPTQKPVPLYKYLLTEYARPGYRILDTHLGSGSIAIACHDYGFDLEAYEIDADYFAAASKRLADHQKQLTLI